MLFAILKKELTLASRRIGNIVTNISFFFISLSIFTLNFKDVADSNLLQQLNIGIIWLCLTFTILMGSNNSFREDFENGNLEQIYLAISFFELAVAAKILANWISACLPLLITIPFTVLFLKIESYMVTKLIIIASLTSFLINIIASFGATLVLSVQNSSSLLVIVVLPLILPAIIFANSAFLEPELFCSSMRFLLLLILFLWPLLTLASSAAIKLNINE